MPLEFDSTYEHCSTLFKDVSYSSRVSEMTVVTNDQTRMSEALFGGKGVPITEDEADTLTVHGAADKRHHTVERAEGKTI
ncbi:MAG: Protein of uncharacterized function [Pseudomonas sp.]|nr:Protein of uncharacterized function [Pseudomonas sp.]